MAGFTMNQVALSGNLTRDPELRTIPSGMAVCEIGLAVNERVKNGQSGEWVDRANFFDITIWGKQGEWIANNLRKGSGLAVTGRLRYESWEDKESGKTRSRVKIVADTTVPIPKREQNQSGGQQQYRSDLPPVDTGDFAPAQTQQRPLESDDIPF